MALVIWCNYYINIFDFNLLSMSNTSSTFAVAKRSPILLSPKAMQISQAHFSTSLRDIMYNANDDKIIQIVCKKRTMKKA